MWDSVCLFTTLALSQLSERGSKNCKTVRNPLKKMFPQLKRKSYILLRQIGQDKISYFIITNRTGISSWSNKYMKNDRMKFHILLRQIWQDEISYCSNKYDRMKFHILLRQILQDENSYCSNKYDRMKSHILLQQIGQDKISYFILTNRTGWNLIFYYNKYDRMKSHFYCNK